MDNNINSIQNVLKYAKKQLQNNNFDTFSLDAELLLMHTLNLSKVELITKSDIVMTLDQQKEYYNLIQRRLKFEPIQYIINKAEFMGLEIYVDKNVLIPRSDTECLVEYAIENINKNKCKNIIDMCTGSGCISLSLLKFCPCIDKIVAVDISEEALCVSKKNFNLHNVINKVDLILSDMFLNIPNNKKNMVDIIISNPPYIDTKFINYLPKNVINFEPRLALDGKEQGVYFYKQLAKNSKIYLNKNGKIFMEIGFDQAKLVEDIFLKEGYNKVEVKKDLSGLDRVIIVDR